MSIRLNGGYVTIDLGAGHAIDLSATGLSVIVGIKKVGNWVDYDPPLAIGGSASSRDGIELHGNGSPGASTNLGASFNGSGIGLSGLSMAAGTWYFLAITRASGLSPGTNAVNIYAGTSGALTLQTTGTESVITNPYRYIRVGDLLQPGLVTKFNGEAALIRAWSSVLTEVQLESETASVTPVITSGLVYGCAWASASDTTDQSGNGITWTATGSVVDGASDPVGGGGGATGKDPQLQSLVNMLAVKRAANF